MNARFTNWLGLGALMVSLGGLTPDVEAQMLIPPNAGMFGGGGFGFGRNFGMPASRAVVSPGVVYTNAPRQQLAPQYYVTQQPTYVVPGTNRYYPTAYQAYAPAANTYYRSSPTYVQRPATGWNSPTGYVVPTQGVRRAQPMIWPPSGGVYRVR